MLSRPKSWRHSEARQLCLSSQCRLSQSSLALNDCLSLVRLLNSQFCYFQFWVWPRIKRFRNWALYQGCGRTKPNLGAPVPHSLLKNWQWCSLSNLILGVWCEILRLWGTQAWGNIANLCILLFFLAVLGQTGQPYSPSKLSLTWRIQYGFGTLIIAGMLYHRCFHLKESLVWEVCFSSTTLAWCYGQSPWYQPKNSSASRFIMFPLCPSSPPPQPWGWPPPFQCREQCALF